MRGEEPVAGSLRRLEREAERAVEHQRARPGEGRVDRVDDAVHDQIAADAGAGKVSTHEDAIAHLRLASVREHEELAGVGLEGHAQETDPSQDTECLDVDVALDLRPAQVDGVRAKRLRRLGKSGEQKGSQQGNLHETSRGFCSAVRLQL